MKSIKECEYSRSRSFYGDLILQDQASGERSQDYRSSGSKNTLRYFCCDSICLMFWSRIFVLFDPYARFHIFI